MIISNNEKRGVLCIMQYRSLLFVPAKEKMLRKISEFTADGYILDLEDSIESENKKEALRTVKQYLNSVPKSDKHLIVRLNKENYEQEYNALCSFAVDFMLPKFEDVDEYSSIISNFNDNKIYALIETPLGIVNAEKIASHNKVKGLAFGAEDYTASMGIENEDRMLTYPKHKLVCCAKAYNKWVFDTPSFSINDEKKFLSEVNESLRYGFNGKMAISPKHVDVINKIFSYVDILEMKRIVEYYEQKGQAVAIIEGQVYEKMHINHMKRIIKENEGRK